VRGVFPAVGRREEPDPCPRPGSESSRCFAYGTQERRSVGSKTEEGESYPSGTGTISQKVGHSYGNRGDLGHETSQEHEELSFAVRA